MGGEVITQRSLSATASSVPLARHAVLEALEHMGMAARSDDACLAVTEIVTNAVLHGREPIIVTIRAVDGGVRVEVHDGSAVSPAFSMLDPTAVTGRGLLLVSAVADTWGVDPDSNGKTVWFTVLSGQDADERVEMDRLLASWADGMAVDPAHEDVRAVITDLNTALLAASEAHTEGLVRELHLLPGSESLLERVTPLDALRLELRRQIVVARAAGDELMDVSLTIRREEAEQVRDFLHALDEIDRLSRRGELLVIPAATEVSAYRQTFLRRLLDQLRS